MSGHGETRRNLTMNCKLIDDGVQSNLQQEMTDLKFTIVTQCQGGSEGDAEAAVKKTSNMSNLIKFVAENPEKGKLMQTLLPTAREKYKP